MRSITTRIRPFVFAALLGSAVGACGGGFGFYSYDDDYDYDYWDNDYYWYGRPWGGYTVVRRPVTVVDGWTNRAFRHRPYRGYRVRRHNSPVIEYTATQGDRTLNVNLKPMGDSTIVEVRARRGKDKYDERAAKVMASSIIREQKQASDEPKDENRRQR